MADATENGDAWRPASDGPGAVWTTLPSGQVELRQIDVTEGARKQWLFRLGRWDRFRRGNLAQRIMGILALAQKLFLSCLPQFSQNHT